VKFGYRNAISSGQYDLQDGIAFGVDIEEQLKVIECVKVWEDVVRSPIEAVSSNKVLSISALECGLSVLQSLRDELYPKFHWDEVTSNLNNIAQSVVCTANLPRGGDATNMSQLEKLIRSINHQLFLEREIEGVDALQLALATHEHGYAKESPRRQPEENATHFSHLFLDTTLSGKRGSGLMLTCLYACLLARVAPDAKCHILGLPDIPKDSVAYQLPKSHMLRNLHHKFLLYIEGTREEQFVIDPAQSMGAFTSVGAEELVHMLKQTFGPAHGDNLPTLSTNAVLGFSLESLINVYGRDGSLKANYLQHRFSDLLTDLNLSPRPSLG